MPFKVIQAPGDLPVGFDVSSRAPHDLFVCVNDMRLSEVGGRLRAKGAAANKERPWTLATSFVDNGPLEVYFQLFYLNYPCGAPIVARMFYAPYLNKKPTCRLPGVRASDFAPNEDDYEEENRFSGVRELMVVDLPDMAFLHLYGAGKWADAPEFARIIADLVYLAATLVRAKKSTEVVVMVGGTCYPVDRVEVTVSETQETVCDHLADMYKFRRFVSQPRVRWNDYVTLMCAETPAVIAAWKTCVALEEEEEEADYEDFSDDD